MMGSNASAFGVSYLVRNASYLGVSSWSEMLATSVFLCWAETPRAVALLKGSDREILSRRVHFVTKFVERVIIVKKVVFGAPLVVLKKNKKKLLLMAHRGIVRHY